MSIRRILLSVWVLVIPLFVMGQSVKWISPESHDFGEIPPRKPVTYEFVFKNTSSSPLIIDNVRSTCGCTAPDWTDDPIPPDSTSVIKVEYDAKKIGYFRKKVRVFFHDVRKAEVLEIEGEVVE